MPANMKFEVALEKLEQIVRKLEGGELNLDESLKAFEDGISLTRTCESLLKDAKGKIEMLIKNENGEAEIKPFKK